MKTSDHITNPFWIIVSGSGKKVGKTYLVTALIRKFSLRVPLTGLKISPHIHDDLGGAEMVAHAEKRYNIYREYEVHRKNSGQYLQAGASRAFFMETSDGNLPEAYNYFRRHFISGEDAVVCESGALGAIIRPAIHIYISDKQEVRKEETYDLQKKADLVLPARDFDPNMVINRISFDDRGWTLSGWGDPVGVG